MEIVEIKDKKGFRRFIGLAWELYRGDDNWVPPLRFDLLNTLRGKGNPMLRDGDHAFFLALEGNRPVGRICVGIDPRLNEAKNRCEGYITLFESIESFETAGLLFDRAAGWLRKRGMTSVKGPISPTNGDDYRGLLVKGFDGPPVLMNSYNPPYYQRFFEEYGFYKHLDLYAYHLDLTQFDSEMFSPFQEVMQKHDYRIDCMDFSNLRRDMTDIKQILDEAMPGEWEDIITPTLDELMESGKKLKLLGEAEGILIARSGGRPVGFVIALPDYNSVLKEMNGSLFPLGVFKFLRYRRKIRGARVLVQFTIPEFRKKNVALALLFRLIDIGKRRGYTYAEGSTIGEDNLLARSAIEIFVEKPYRIYRIYKKNLGGC